MVTSFVSFLFKKKEQKKKKIKILITLAFVFVFVFFIIHILNIFLLKAATKDVLDSFNKNDAKINYQLHSNFFTGNIVVNDVDFQVKNGKAGCNIIKIKKTSGIFVPTEINVILQGMSTTISNDYKSYSILQRGNENGFYVKFDWHFLSKPSFSGIKVSSPAIYLITDGEKLAGKIKIDDFSIIIDGDKRETKYVGSMIFHNNAFLPYVFLLDTPFAWNINLQEFKTKEYNGFNKNELIDVNNIKINKFFMDFDFSKLSILGNLKHTSSKLKNINVKIDIDNDKNFINNIFNMSLRNKSDSTEQIKKFHKSLDEVIKQLKKNNENSNEDKLQLIVKKTDAMSDYTINSISLSEIIEKISKSIQHGL